ncbi:lysylphosphatidylglycerol synthase domain-containing protein [Frateuria soli]|uniref:lysylphosphatidylglycerol synthase domain-containing protein n=1 Tax=Frateuria soli TaxID=1542730 RepID=UPI001E3568F0|nr:lysylphosphatidylglycerol synthase domain-containing protein [Frateuria soli]UGB37565.1 flippase-like domain-containing protein [Frateuria soli]
MKQVWRTAGLLLGMLTGVYFLVHARRTLASSDLSGLLNVNVLASTVCLAALYALAIPATALAWVWMLRSMKQPASLCRMLPILATTQFAKYLPGNVAQHIGRIALARGAGLDLPAVLFSISWEMLLTVVACTHVSALTLFWTGPVLAHGHLAAYRAPLLLGVTLAVAAALLLAPPLVSRLALLRAGVRSDPTAVPPRVGLAPSTVLGCYAIYVTNFFLIGGGLWLVSHAIAAEGTPAPGVIFLTGAFASSWILGFVTPGAPAGLGIRETVLAALLAGSLPPTQAVALIVALRVATTIGDLAVFIAGSLAMRQLHNLTSPPA